MIIDPSSPISDSAQRRLATLERLLALPATDTHITLDQATQLVAEELGADKVDAFLYDPAIDSLVALGTSDTPLGHRQEQLGLDRLARANGGSAVRVFESGSPYHTGRADQNPDELPGITQALGIRSTLCVPLNVEGRCRGVLQVDSMQPDHFSLADLEFLQAVAVWLGLVLHRSELVEHITRETAAEARRLAADELVTILAHDLRAPLTPVTGYLGMLRNKAENEGHTLYEYYATRALSGIDRLDHMIRDLLDSARLEQGLFVLTLTPLNLVTLVRKTTALLETPAAPVTVQAPPSVLCEGDDQRLRQVIENLLSNAQRHTPAGVPVRVEVGTEAGDGREWAVVTVRDSGPGISPELLPRIFERFSGRQQLQGQGRGLGLGLYLARGIAHAHAGMLTVESEPGRGATFRLMLPIDEVLREAPGNGGGRPDPGSQG